ncbi:Spermidine N(1)-acetyltransferase [Yokenella regensburgei]|nr:Spermidine N(1)-acetyltransferase [Yokenella regensburgei]
MKRQAHKNGEPMATVTTPRLHLSPFQPSDWNFFRLLREDTRVMRYIAAVASEKDNRLLFATRLTAPHTFVVRLHNSPTPLGDIGLKISPHNREEADVGYMFMPEAQGKGIATEAIRALCEYAFTQAGVKALNAWVLADNVGSVRVLEKLGFVRTQMLEQAYEINGVCYDDWVYRLEADAF